MTPGFVVLAFAFTFVLKSIQPYVNRECQYFAEFSLLLLIILGIVSLLPRLAVVENKRALSAIAICIGFIELGSFFSFDQRFTQKLQTINSFPP